MRTCNPDQFVPFTDECEACAGTGSIAVAWGWSLELNCRVPTDVECDACKGTGKANLCAQCHEDGADFRDGWGDGEFWCAGCQAVARSCRTDAEDCGPAMPGAVCTLCRERHFAEDQAARERDLLVRCEIERRGCGLKGGA